MLQSYGGYTYGVTLGADPAKELIETKFVAKNKNNQAISYESYLKDGKKYLKYHNKTDYIYAGEAKLEDFDKFYSFLSFGDILELSKNNLASATLCLSPPDILIPFSPSSVDKPFSNLS